MASQDDIIAEQKEHIDSLRKAVAMLDARLRHMEKRQRSADALLRNNARDIRNLAIQLQGRTNV